MKKTTAYILLLITALFFTSFQVWPGKTFEGVITYKITYPDSKYTESQLAMFPKLMTISVKGNKAMTEINTTMGNQREIIDYVEKTKIGLIDLMGQKFAVKQTAEEIEKENSAAAKPKVELTNETKLIAGYTCRKAIVTVEENGTKTTYEVYYTDEFGSQFANFDNPIYKDISGVLMEFTMKTQQFTMKFSVSNIEKKTISSKIFEIPPDFKLTTQEELKSKYGGMAQ